MSFDLCGIGNACIDITAHVDDAFLAQWNYPKSICTYLLLDEANRLEAALTDPAYIPGGCAANVAATISALGGKSAFMGRLAKDTVGAKFLKDLETRNIRYIANASPDNETGSTRVFALITPDKERTFATYYGVQEDIDDSDLDELAIRQSNFLYLDGYALNSRKGGHVFLNAAATAHSADKLVAFAPSDLSILDKYSAAVNAIIDVSDVILCNKQEALLLSQTDNLQDAIKFLQGMFARGSVTVGDQGAYVFDKSTAHHIPAATLPGPMVDTNGAGDAFAGGFLYGLSNNMRLEQAARLGNLCAAAIITRAGARPAPDCQPLLKALAA
ncbi:MAG: hypothetical protein DI551_09170 [Micavibrio aeruginosavorus]|uniref:Carbohydrate kinase PfkB domain-containing protein n=1 Tax=Micavibrio aeruginosavorus TaxID=349221 RepID=A0A2W5MUR9_9BACT|nr:MAG: hypothetical protein DI551_09170 [Micavibrio aeruginosavorus]